MLTMEVHDYEYYQAHAKDVKLEDITSDEDNAYLLQRLRDNDPKFTELSIYDEVYRRDGSDFIVREGDHIGWLGYFVGKSEKLETLYIDNIPQNINLNTFLKGLGRNRSIQELCIGIDIGESFQSLIPFLRNNDSLRDLTFTAFGIGLQCARNIALFLSQQSSLKCLAFEETNLDDEELAQITIALRSQPQLEEIRLDSNNVVREGYVALGNALEDCPNLRKLDLQVFQRDDTRTAVGNISNEGLVALAEGLKYCHHLTSLNMLGNLVITEQVSRSLSTLFTSDNCRLEHLDLDEMNIDDDVMTVLATGLASLSSLKRLILRRMSTGDQGLQDLSRALVHCNLEELCISHNMLLDSVSGMRALGTLVAQTTNMQSLDLSSSCVTDAGLQSFVEAMSNCCSLTELCLSRNLITGNGMTSLSSLFRAECCTLCTLFLYGINIGDDGAEILANGLIGNMSLTTLSFDVSGITARGWAAFRRLLSDTSSVNNTYLSNHTLVEIRGHIGEYDMRNTPQDIVQYLKWNESHNQAAAICKILHGHPDIDVTPLFGFNLMCLHLVVEWFEKAKSYVDKVNVSTDVFKNRQLSAVYKFIRGMPLVAANGFRSQKVKDVQLHLVKSKKRKLDQAL